MREGRGNPLFLSELARVADRGDGALPPTLVAAVSFEVAALAHEPRALIQGAAVAGEPFDPELAAAIAGLDPASAPAGARRAGRRRPRPPGPGAEDTCAGPARQRRGASRARRVDASPCGAPLDPHLVPPAGAGPRVRLPAPAGAPRGLRRLRARLAARRARARRGRPRGARRRARGPRLPRRALGARRRRGRDRGAERGGRGRRPVLARGGGALVRGGAAARARPRPRHPRRPARAPRARARRLRPAAGGAHGAARGARARAASWSSRSRARGSRPSSGCTPTPAGGCSRRASARRRPSTRRWPSSWPPAPSTRVASRELRGWAEPAVLAAREDPLLLVGAEALFALGALWRGDPQTAAAALDRASSGLDALDDATLASHPAVPVYVGIAQFLLERFAAATGDERPGAGDRAPHRPGPARRHADRRCGRSRSRSGSSSTRALHEAEAAEEAARLQGVPHLLHFALWIRALVHDVRGEATEAERAAREGARADGEPGAEQAHPHGRVRVRGARRRAAAGDQRDGRGGRAAARARRPDAPHVAAAAAGARGDRGRRPRPGRAVGRGRRARTPSGCSSRPGRCGPRSPARRSCSRAGTPPRRRSWPSTPARPPTPSGRRWTRCRRAWWRAGRWRRRAMPAPATSCSASPATRAAPAPRACTRPRGASCAGSARASPLPPAAPRGATRP